MDGRTRGRLEQPPCARSDRPWACKWADTMLSSGGANGKGPRFPDVVDLEHLSRPPSWKHARVPITCMRSIQNVHEIVSYSNIYYTLGAANLQLSLTHLRSTLEQLGHMWSLDERIPGESGAMA